MKVLKKILIILFVLLLVSGTVVIIIGYSNYMGLIREESLATRMGEISKDEHFVSFENLPKNYVNAVVAVEDHRFYEHGAIDIIGIGRALYTNLKNFELQEGGSTITQQVAKNVILGQDQTLIRKISEIFAAFAPTVNLDLAKQRQRHVLDKMVEYGYITQAEADSII